MAVDYVSKDTGRNIRGKWLLSIRHLDNFLNTVCCPLACILKRLARWKTTFQNHLAVRALTVLWVLQMRWILWDVESSKEKKPSFLGKAGGQATYNGHECLQLPHYSLHCPETVFVGVRQQWRSADRSRSLSVDPEVKTQLHLLYVHYSSIKVKVKKKIWSQSPDFWTTPF